jgi:hypothetical protein
VAKRKPVKVAVRKVVAPKAPKIVTPAAQATKSATPLVTVPPGASLPTTREPIAPPPSDSSPAVAPDSPANAPGGAPDAAAFVGAPEYDPNRFGAGVPYETLGPSADAPLVPEGSPPIAAAGLPAPPTGVNWGLVAVLAVVLYVLVRKAG